MREAQWPFPFYEGGNQDQNGQVIHQRSKILSKVLEQAFLTKWASTFPKEALPIYHSLFKTVPVTMDGITLCT